MPRTTFFTDWVGRSAAFLIVGSIVASFALSVGVLLQIAGDQNERALEHSRSFLQAAVEQELEKLEATGKDYGDWGEAYKNLHPTVNFPWAAANMGRTLYENLGADIIAVVGPQRNTVYSVVEGRRVPGELGEALQGGVQALVDRALQSGVKTVPVTGFLLADGVPAVAVAAAIGIGSDLTVQQIAGPRSVLVLATRLTPQKVQAMGDRFFVPALRVADAGSAEDPVWSMPTEDGSGKVALAWTPERPGDELLTRVLPWVAAAAAFLVLLTILVVRQGLFAARALRLSSSELAKAHRHAQHLAMHDVLTGLPNRMMLARVLEDALRHREPDQCVGLLYLDLDRFKPVNDVLGHAAGDDVLTEFARRLRSAIGENDLVARIGGDEFVVAIRSSKCPAEIEAVCRTIQQVVIAPFAVGGTDVEIGVSIGIALSPGDAQSAEEAIRLADIAMYRAKAENPGSYLFYSPEMNSLIAVRRAMELDMRRAIAADEFIVHFQPRFDTDSLKVVSVEALARWQHPTRGLLLPGDFIGFAEETGLIAQIGNTVLRKACAAIAPYPEIGVSVNLSPVQFRTGDVQRVVAEALAQTGLAATRLELEITEGVLLEDTEKARVALQQLKAIGVTLAMDDFGTGYSSLGYLQTFPFDRLKIDRAFIARLEPTGDARAIVQAIIGLGRALGMAVTAEGVESAEQLTVLQADDCGEVQGYHMARPLAEEALAEFMNAPQGRDLRAVSCRKSVN